MDNTAAIIGAGLIGRSWAMVFARAGWRVRLYDAVPAQLDAARTFIATGLAEQARHELAAAALGPPAASTDIERRMRWRDRRLMALVAHKRQQSASEPKE